MREPEETTIVRLFDLLCGALEKPFEQKVRIAYVEHAEVVAKREEEDRLDAEGYSRKYILELRERIRRGERPTRPLIASRPQFLYFKDAVEKKRRA